MRRRRDRKRPKSEREPLRLDRCGPTGKVRFRSEGAAREALRQLRAQRHHDPAREERRAYRCWQCAGWHLTKQPYGEARGDISRELPAPTTKEGKATA